jgi:hypothetical protein
MFTPRLIKICLLVQKFLQKAETLNTDKGCTIAQAVSRWLPTAAAQVQI